MRVDVAALHRQLLSALDHELPQAVGLRHRLHADPRCSGDEEDTAATVVEHVGEAAAPVVAGTGRVMRFGSPGPAVAVRAELDALPVHEVTGAPYAAVNGAMHACGHDVHLAALAALGRATRGVVLPFALLAVLQPREETYPSGALEIVRSGLLAEQDAHACVGVHVSPNLPAGRVSAGAGIVNAAADEFEILVTGRGGHAGYPHQSRDSVVALAACVLAVQHLVSRRTDPRSSVVVSIGTLHADGAANIVPERARATGSLRSLDPERRDALREALRTTVEHTAAAYGCEGRLTLTEGEPALRNDPLLARAVERWLEASGLGLGETLRSCGADDFAYFASALPSIMLFVGVGAPGGPGLHDPRFLPDDAAVTDVARAMLAGYVGAVSVLAG